MKKTLALLVALLATSVLSRELVYNGDFELPADSGWQAYAWGDFPDTGNCRLWRRHTHHQDRDFEMMLHKMLNKGFRLFQKVEIPDKHLGFSVSCRLTSKTESEPYYAAACISLEYLDARDTVLGETRIYSATSGCNWTSSSRLHLIRAPDSLTWHDYNFHIDDELDNLPDVDPDSVAAVNIALFGYVDQNG
jgi:hypothetical protein